MAININGLHLLAIDPGNNTGLAAFRYGPEGWTLVRVGLIRTDARNPSSKVGDLLGGLESFLSGVPGYRDPPGSWGVAEYMVFRPDDSRSVAEDLIQVATIAGVLNAKACTGSYLPQFVTPQEWKGSVPKDLMESRIRAALSTTETRVAESSGVPLRLMHNTIDAIGIGLFASGRMRRGGAV
jgi:hypothetical protein